MTLRNQCTRDDRAATMLGPSFGQRPQAKEGDSNLARSIERVVPSEDLWRAAWGEDKPLNGGSLHVYIHRLRNNLRPYQLRIDALVNVGYRLLTNK